MVYNKTKKTASIDSLKNKPTGGGEKKAGLPYQIGRDSWTNTVYIQPLPLSVYQKDVGFPRYYRPRNARLTGALSSTYKIV